MNTQTIIFGGSLIDLQYHIPPDPVPTTALRPLCYGPKPESLRLNCMPAKLEMRNCFRRISIKVWGLGVSGLGFLIWGLRVRRLGLRESKGGFGLRSVRPQNHLLGAGRSSRKEGYIENAKPNKL